MSILEPPIGIKSPCLDASQDRATKSSHGAHHNALAELGYAHILPRNTNILKYTTFILLTKILFFAGSHTVSLQTTKIGAIHWKDEEHALDVF